MIDANPIWPRRFRFAQAFAVLVSFVVLGWFVHVWKQRADPLQGYYLATYVRTSLPPVPFWTKYTVVRYKAYLATPGDPGPFFLEKRKIDPELFHSFLLHSIYGGSIWRTLRWPLIGWGLCLVPLLAAGRYIDNSRNREARRGNLIRGPRLISKWRFNLGALLRRKRDRGFWIETR